jgi:xylan 1,4-beta-xylosidase
MKQSGVLFLTAILLVACTDKPGIKESDFTTVCNPVDLNYRFCPEKPSRREAADPTVILFKDRFYLVASKSGGYWHSENLTDWILVETNKIPIEEYAPTAISIEDTIYFLASSGEKSTIYKSTDPLSGIWDVAKDSIDFPVWDPAFFLDDDNRLYLYWGCSNQAPIYGVQIDYKNDFSFIGEPVELIFAKPDQFGWEVPGDYNTKKSQAPWIEGAWMNKYKGKYYLQYAGPGTEFKSYSDGVYMSDDPLGPYTVSPHNPFANKPEGFAAGAGHGSTFTDKFGNYWHIGTITISVKHLFERSLGLYPTFFDEDGILYAVTKFGDYPVIVPQKRIEDFEDIFPGWMLLSYMKEVDVSSSIDSLPPINMVDENIRTYWAATSGGDNDWAGIDLGEEFDVYSLQVNFAEHNTEIYGRQENLYYQYLVEFSRDNISWDLLVDKSDNQSDNSHDYIQLPEKVTCRYVRIKNISLPGGHFALSGFRVFGKGSGDKPDGVNRLEATRSPYDRRIVKLHWEKSKHATGYNISYGTDQNKLYHNYIVYQDTSLHINSLNATQVYYFAIESFNENGITPAGTVVAVE